MSDNTSKAKGNTAAPLSAEEQLAALQAKFDALNAQKAEDDAASEEMIATLKSKLESTQKAASANGPKLVTVDGKQYEVVIPHFTHASEKDGIRTLSAKTAQDVLDDVDLARELVSISSGVLALVTE